MTPRASVLLFFVLIGSASPLVGAEHHHRTRCGTLHGSEAQRVDKLGSGIQADRPRPVLPFYLDAPGGLFRVHYATDGPDAVPPNDLDADGIPDYVVEAVFALEHSWLMQQRYQAPPQPPSDGVAGGSPALDVYLRDLSMAGPSGAGYYGITIPDSVISSGGGRWPRFTTWMEIDNNFAAGDTNIFGDTVFATTGIAGLRITCAHELHHVAQLGRFGNANVQLMLYEQMATYMELVCYPEYDDWRMYASKFFRDPAAYAFGDASAFAGYVWGWFPLAYGTADQHVYEGVFRAMERGERPFPALVQATASAGVHLDSTFVQLLPDLYYTGERAESAAKPSVIPTPDALPEISWHRSGTALPPAVLSTGEVRPFEVRAFQFTIPSSENASPISTTALVTWTDLEAYQTTEFPSRRAYQLLLQQFPDSRFQPIAGTTWGIRIEPGDLTLWVNNAATIRPPQPYPLPVMLSTDPTIHVPIPGALPGDPVVAHLRTVSMGMLQEYRTTVRLDHDRIVTAITLPTTLVPGVYVVSTEHNGTTNLHKIAVHR